jgi:hypothetical protein
MKKILLLVVLMSCLPLAAYAAPTYGTKMPHQMQVYGGVQSHTIFNRKLENDDGKIRSQQEFALLSLGLFDWLSLDLKGGAGNLDTVSGPQGDVNYNTFLAGGYGFRLRLYDDELNKAVFGFQHISVHPFSKMVDNIKHKVVLDDWQFSLLASHDFKVITPYIGTRFGWMNQILWTNGGNRKLDKSDMGHSVGLIVGSDIPLCKHVWINVEGQFFDATAVAGSLNFSF